MSPVRGMGNRACLYTDVWPIRFFSVRKKPKERDGTCMMFGTANIGRRGLGALSYKQYKPLEDF